MVGALAARLIADFLPVDQRIPVWLAGGAVIFIGLAILSLGSRPEADPPADAAGEEAIAEAATAEAATAEAAAAAHMVETLAARDTGTKPPEPIARQSIGTATAGPAGRQAPG